MANLLVIFATASVVAVKSATIHIISHPMNRMTATCFVNAWYSDRRTVNFINIVRWNKQMQEVPTLFVHGISASDGSAQGDTSSVPTKSSLRLWDNFGGSVWDPKSRIAIQTIYPIRSTPSLASQKHVQPSSKSTKSWAVRNRSTRKLNVTCGDCASKSYDIRYSNQCTDYSSEVLQYSAFLMSTRSKN